MYVCSLEVYTLMPYMFVSHSATWFYLQAPQCWLILQGDSEFYLEAGSCRFQLQKNLMQGSIHAWHRMLLGLQRKTTAYKFTVSY